MIHLYALDPRLVATWGKLEEFRYIHDKFGFGTPRALLELPKLTKWKRAIYEAVLELGLSDSDKKRIEELFRIFAEHKHRPGDMPQYDQPISWLEKAELEYERRPFRAILAASNPRGHQGVVLGQQLDVSDPRWTCTTGAIPSRTPDALAAALQPMLVNCRAVHVIDPYFRRYEFQIVLEKMMQVASMHGAMPEEVWVHCSTQECLLPNFERDVRRMAEGLPNTIMVSFIRWKERKGGEKLHNRYVLPNLGGVSLGAGFEAGTEGQTDDVLLLPSDLYKRRWKQYVENDGSFEKVDTPTPVRGRASRAR